MPLSKGAKQIDGPFEGNGLEICRDLGGLMRRLELERGIKADTPQEQVPTQVSARVTTMLVEIPKGDFDAPGPCWIPTTRYDNGAPCKPLIKCNCGKVTGIGLHHVHADGLVTASFYHSEASEFTDGGKIYKHEPGCGWHVHLKLKDYDLGEFPPVP